MRKCVFAGLLIWGLLFAVFAPRQALGIELYGRIRGVVSDPTGAVIAGATVTVINNSTRISKTVTTSADGSFEVFQLPAPSTYTVKAEKSGFKTYEAQTVRLSVDQVYVLNVQMQLGQVTQQVTVEAAPTQVEKTSIQLSATVSGNTIVDMPLNGRNWTQLQQTLPGVVSAADGRGNYATNGSEPGQNSFLINGIDSNDLPLNTPLVIPSPDSIAEFNMVTNTINPEYGRNSGAIMNVVTKSGGNSFHGDGFEFFRDTGLNARNFFQPRSIVFHQHQFGGTVGGPIKKDKAFFFFSYQGTRNIVPQAGGTVTVFTPDQRNGIFTDIATSTATSPFPMVGENGTTYPAGTAYSTIFPTGHIPSADFNPIATSLMNKFVPLPNSGSEYDFNPVTTGKDDQYMTRIDTTLTSKDSLWGSWYWERHPTVDTLPFTGSTLPGFGESAQRHIQNYSLSWNHTFSATTLNEARIGYTRFNFVAVQPLTVLDPKTVGFTGINVEFPNVSSYPLINVTGLFSLGFSNNGPQPRIDQTYQVDDNFTKIMGRHTVKIGFDMRRFQVYNPFFFDESGVFDFGGSGAYSTGDPGADFLLGIPDDYTQGGGDFINARGQEYYTYFQDQFRIRKNLTLTFGTGWTVDVPTVDIFHNNHAMVAWRPGQQSTIFTNAPKNYLFQGDPGVHAAGTTKYGHFGPRFGFAWSPGNSGKWSLRGGYGIFFNRELEEQSLQYLGDAPYAIFSTGAADFGGSPSFAAPFTDIAGGGAFTNKFPYPLNPPSNIDFSSFLPLLFQVQDPNTSVPYAQSFNLTLERQLTGNTVFSAAYVGELARKLVVVRDLNPGLNPSGCAADPVCVEHRNFQGFYFPQNFQYDPFTFLGVGNDQTTGISNYNALQVTLNKRMSHGLQLYTAYTWSHAMDNGSGFENSAFGGGGFGAFGSTRGTDPFNQTLRDYGPSTYDAQHRVVITYTYDIPAVRHFSNWAAKRFFEGWRMNGITTFQSGFPLDVVDRGFRSLTCWSFTWDACWDVPNTLGAPQYGNPRNDAFVNTATSASNTTSKNHYWFDPNTFARAPFGVQGDAGRNILRGPGIANFDWGFFKDTQVTESTRMELRFEFFNLFNHTQFDPRGVTTNTNSSNFGRILAARDPRLIQLAAKFCF